jgi:hypothetical protein
MCIVGRGLFGPTRNVVFDKATAYESFDSEPIRADWVLGMGADGHHAAVVAFVSLIYEVLARISEGVADLL